MSYTIDCTGDAVVGDKVCFQRAVFKGSYFSAKFSHYETVEAEIIKDSYGKDKQQHTFTLLLEDGSKTRIKGRNLYKNGCMRMPWPDEEKRKEIAHEKHQRGDMARDERQKRREMEGYCDDSLSFG